MQNLTTKKSFTLVELMIVIAILAILAIIVIFSLNPGMLFNRFRDNNRVSDVNTLFKAIQYRSVWDDSGTSFKGDSTKVYISLPDTDPGCSTYTNLPEIPAGLTYACATEENLRKTDGTGWVPIDFTNNNNPINTLPIDPINTENNYLSYYFNGNDFAIQAIMQTTTNPNALEDGNPQTYTKKSDRYANVPIPNEDMYPVVFASKVSMIDRFEASNNGSNIPQSKPFQTPWTHGDPGGNAT